MNIAKLIASNTPLGQVLSSIAFLLAPSVQERQLLERLHRHKFFYSGLAIRFVLIFTAVPQIQQTWFVPFVSHHPITINPWESFLATGGDLLAFPYGIVMYLAYLPLTTAGWGLDQLLSTSWLAKIGFGLTSLAFDYCLVLAIALLARRYSVRLLLVAYWCSPVVIYITYCHGQLDIIPVCLLVWGILLLQRQRPWVAGVLIGLAFAAKYSMIAALPFLIVYLIRNPRLRSGLRPLIGAISLALVFATLPFLSSHAYTEMVIRTPEAARIYAVYLAYGPKLSLFLLPTAYIVTLYLVWRLERITLDLFVISVGIGFFALLLLLPPAPGWFLWVMPFLVFYQVRSKEDFLLATLPFYGFYLIYNLLYSAGADFPGLGIQWSQPIAQSLEVDNPRTNSLLFTAQQASGLLVCLRMYIFGINRNNYYRRGRYPLVVGLAGDSGTGKDAYVASLARVLGNTSIAHVSGDNYHKWERHDPMWTAKTNLNPHANNLSRLTQDVFALADGKPIRYRSYDHKTGRFNGTDTISSADIVIVSGLHTLYVNRLRRRLDLRIFLDCDEDLRLYWKSQHDTHETAYDQTDLDVSSEQRRLDSDAYIYTQAKYADLIFKLSLVNPNHPIINHQRILQPRLKLLVTMDNGFFHEELIHCLIALCGMHIDIEQSPHLDSISLCIEGDINGEDVAQVADLLIPNLEDIVLPTACWESGPAGLMQLVTLVHISDSFRRNGRTSHA